MMKILMFNHGSGFGGAERFIFELSNELEQKGHKVAFCFSDSKNSIFKGKKTYFINKSGILPELLELRRIINDFKPDIIHTHNINPFIRGSIIGIIKEIPVIHTQHGYQKLSFTAGVISNILALYASGFVFVSNDMMKNSRMLFKENQMRINNGIKTEFSEKKKNKTFRIGAIARLEKVKDIMTLIGAFDILGKNKINAELVIIGDGGERRNLESYADSLGLKSVFFKGFMDNSRKHVSSFDLFVSSSLSEGISISILEAMSCKVPVIATSVGGTPEIIKNNFSGFLIPAKNPEILAEKIEFVIKNRHSKFIKEMAENARKKVIDYFSIKRAANQYEALYKEVFRL